MYSNLRIVSECHTRKWVRACDLWAIWVMSSKHYYDIMMHYVSKCRVSDEPWVIINWVIGKWTCEQLVHYTS